MRHLVVLVVHLFGIAADTVGITSFHDTHFYTLLLLRCRLISGCLNGFQAASNTIPKEKP
ncbi:hypothetical protein [uncultured Kingella sp.]|uniref:hypothetical protein n=1 Tax=uncultured Kingella sp. TaxID=159270 RepID=UPI002594A4D1|nr:hypothetical protein [uncultured Kingella sp.]